MSPSHSTDESSTTEEFFVPADFRGFDDLVAHYWDIDEKTPIQFMVNGQSLVVKSLTTKLAAGVLTFHIDTKHE